MVVVDRVDCDHAVRTFHAVGDASPMHATAVGRSILAHLPKQDVDEVIAHGLTRYTDATPADPAQLHAELDRIRAEGYAANRSQYRVGVCAFAAPVLDAAGTPVASVGISMPESRYDDDRVPEWGGLVVSTATEITTNLVAA